MKKSQQDIEYKAILVARESSVLTNVLTSASRRLPMLEIRPLAVVVENCIQRSEVAGARIQPRSLSRPAL